MTPWIKDINTGNIFCITNYMKERDVWGVIGKSTAGYGEIQSTDALLENFIYKDGEKIDNIDDLKKYIIDNKEENHL